MSVERIQCAPQKAGIRIFAQRRKRCKTFGRWPEEAQGQCAATAKKVAPGKCHNVFIDPSFHDCPKKWALARRNAR
jgi:hypothetical protein